MPVGNQWRTRGGRAATVTEEPPPAKDPEPTGPHGKRVGRLQNFRTKSQDKAEPAPAAKDGATADGADHPSSGKKSLGEKWTAASAAAQDDGKMVRKKRLEVTETAVDGDAAVTDPANVGIILENEPVRLEGVVRADDPSEFTKPLEVEKGFAKNLASRFLQQQQQDATPGGAERRRFRMDVAPGEPEVHENEPVRLEGVVRSGDKTEDVIGKRGAIKSIADRFVSPRDSDSEDSSDDNDDSGRRRGQHSRRPVVPLGDSASGSDAVVLAENVPAELDPSVVRSTDGYRANDPVMESGRTRNMAERWRQQQEQDASASTAGGRSAKPAWLVELENAKESEYGVFENEPEVRDDVVRADDDTPDVISVQHTRSLRQMWTQIERDRDQPPSRPPPVKPKEPSPEPPKSPPEEPKPTIGRFGVRRPVGRLQGIGQLQQKEEPAPASPPGKPGNVKGVGGKGPSTAAAVQPNPLEVETKSSKLYVKPSLKPIQKKK